MDDPVFNEDENRSELFETICRQLEGETKTKFAMKISSLEATVYSTGDPDDLTGEVIFRAMLGFWGRIYQSWNFFLGGFDERNLSLTTRIFTEIEIESLEKLFFNFCCLNGLKYKPCNGLIRPGLADPNAITYSFELLDDLFLINEKL